MLKLFDADADPDPGSGNLFGPGSGILDEKIRILEPVETFRTRNTGWGFGYVPARLHSDSVGACQTVAR
jgi:hypothetical protein